MTELEKARQSISEIDREMARLFVRRMDAVRTIAAYKRENGISVEDPAREKQVIENGSAIVNDPGYRTYYTEFLRHQIELSKEFQRSLLDE